MAASAGRATFREQTRPRAPRRWPAARPRRPAIAAARARIRSRSARSRTWLRTCSRAACSTSSPTPNTRFGSRFATPTASIGESRAVSCARTRAEPQPAADGKIYHVYPVGYEGPRQEPSFTGLMAAYYMAGRALRLPERLSAARAARRQILVHAGLYFSDRHHYMNRAPAPGYLALGTVFDGTYYLTQSGTPERPIVIKAAGDGEVVFDGDGAENLFNLMARELQLLRGHHGSQHERRASCSASRASPARAVSR